VAEEEAVSSCSSAIENRACIVERYRWRFVYGVEDYQGKRWFAARRLTVALLGVARWVGGGRRWCGVSQLG